MRQLVSVQRIVNIEPLLGCDNIELVQVLGWWCIVAKSEGFKVGDLVVYFEIDSMIPEYMRETLSFMSRTNWRVRTIKMRGAISQGVVISVNDCLSIISKRAHQLGALISMKILEEGDDLTERLEVFKYEPPQQDSMKCGQSAGKFIDNCPKTDESRIQSVSNKLFETMKELDTTYVASFKVDGSSATYSLIDNLFIVCSHNLKIKKPENEDIKSDFWNAAIELDIENKMRSIAEKYGLVDWALQGELCGPGIQQNRQKFSKKTVRFFYIFDITKQQYVEHDIFKSIIEEMGLQTVPYYSEDFNLKEHTTLTLLELVNSIKYPETNTDNEGLVIYSAKNFTVHRLSKFGRISFKVISNNYLLKEK